MGLVTQRLHITPNAFGVLDGRAPSGIPIAPVMGWFPVPDYLQKDQGTPFSVDISIYLTSSSGDAVSFSLLSGTWPAGWSISSDGTVSYDGSAIGAATVSIRATQDGVSADSNSFTVESIAVASADLLAPTIPVGLSVVSKTATTINATCEAPADISASDAVPYTGMKEVRWFKGGVLDGTSAMSNGLSLRLSEGSVSSGAGGRKFVPGHYTLITRNQRDSSSGIPNATHVWDTGPITSDTVGLVIRYGWDQLEGASGSYTFDKITADLAALAALKTAHTTSKTLMLFVVVEIRTFTGSDASLCPLPPYLISTSLVGGTGTGATTYAETFTGGGNTGWQVWRWSPTVLARFQALCNALGAAFDTNPNYAGISTQETSTGGAVGGSGEDAYTADRFEQALKDEGAYIANGCKTSRHLMYFNSINAAGSGTSSLKSRFTRIAAELQPLGMICGGPDLGMGPSASSAISNLYPVYNLYQGGTGGIPAAGPTFCSIQNQEFAGSGGISDPALYEDLVDYFRGAIRSTSAVTFNASVGGKAVGTLTSAAQNGSWNLYFDNGQVRAVTVTGGTAVSWSGALNAGTVTTGRITNTTTGSFKFNGGDILVENWVTGNQTGNPNTDDSPQKFSTDMAAAIHAHPTFGSFVAAGSFVAGTLDQANADYTIVGNGAGLGGTGDEWTLGRAPITNDATIIAKLASVTGTSTASAFAGLSFRQDSTAGSKAVHLIQSSAGLTSTYRSIAGSTATTVSTVATPVLNTVTWFKINRTGDLFSFYYSTNGLAWTALGSQSLALGSSIYAEVFAGSGTSSTITASFQQICIQNLANPTYTFSGLTASTAYSLTAVARDNASNDSAASATLNVTTSGVAVPAYIFRSAGTAVNGTSVTPGAPAGVVAGDLLLLRADLRNNTDTFATPSGWTKISPNTTVTWSDLYARIATGDAGDAPPTISSVGVNAIVVQMAAFHGSVYTGGLGSIVHAANDKHGTNTDILYSALTVSTDNCLVLALGAHNKTGTSNGATVNSLAGFTQMDNGSAPLGQLNPNGSSLSFWWGYQQQTTATNLGAVTQTRTGTGESLQYTSSYIALKTS